MCRLSAAINLPGSPATWCSSPGVFFDASEVLQRDHVALLIEKLAKKLYGSQSAAVGGR